jgi:hypothetical protein
MIDRARWDDRAVTFVDMTQLEGDAVLDAYAESARTGTRMLLVYGLRYTDTGERVFASVAEIEALPFRHLDRLTYLAARCARQNGMRAADPDAPTGEEGTEEGMEAKANGHDAAARPSP